MKLLFLLLLLSSFSVFADETCFTSIYDFRITNSYIEATGQGEYVRIAYSDVRTLSRRSRSDFKSMIANLSDELNADVVLSIDEAALIERFTLTMADGTEEITGMMYTKAYDKSGMLVVRYIVTKDGAYRCK